MSRAGIRRTQFANLREIDVRKIRVRVEFIDADGEVKDSAMLTHTMQPGERITTRMGELLGSAILRLFDDADRANVLASVEKTVRMSLDK